MSAARRFRLPPAGRRIPARDLLRLRRHASAPQKLRDALAERLGGGTIELVDSGREGLRRAFVSACCRTGRQEIVVPAYTCFSVAAAAVAAGARVRLVDVTLEGSIDPEALESIPLERAAAVVACNLFGFAEPLCEVERLAREAGALLVDDAAQAFGAVARDGAAGARGDLGVVSFGRGKPLAALGGGALISAAAEAGAFPAREARPWRSVARALAYDVALLPQVFGWLASLPMLGIGETPFDPGFDRGGLASDRAALALAALERFDAETARRREVALDLGSKVSERSGFGPLRVATLAAGVQPRLVLLAPDARARERASNALDRLGAGASTLYPCALGEVPALAASLVGERTQPRAAELASRLLTLPTHGGLEGEILEATLRALNAASCT